MPRAPRARSSDDVELGEVLVQRGRRQAVAVDHDQRRRASDALGQLRAAVVGQRAAEIGALQEDRLVGRARRHLEHPEAGEQLRIDLGQHRVLGGGVIGAEAQHRVGVVARADAPDGDARRRRGQHARHHRRIVGLADVDAAIGRQQQRAGGVQLARGRRRARARRAGQRFAHHRFDAGAVDGGRRGRLHDSSASGVDELCSSEPIAGGIGNPFRVLMIIKSGRRRAGSACRRARGRSPPARPRTRARGGSRTAGAASRRRGTTSTGS